MRAKKTAMGREPRVQDEENEELIWARLRENAGSDAGRARATSEVVELTLFSILRLMQGRLSVKSIGGPLTIFDVAGTAAREGALNYLTLMAFISINLGLINLLPIPLLDGGQLLFTLFEAVLRRPMWTTSAPSVGGTCAGTSSGTAHH